MSPPGIRPRLTCRPMNKKNKRMLVLHTFEVVWWWWCSCQVVSDSCDLMDCNLPGSSVHGIYQARILEWVIISFSRGSSPPRDQTDVSGTANEFLPLNHQGSPQHSKTQVGQKQNGVLFCFCIKLKINPGISLSIQGRLRLPMQWWAGSIPGRGAKIPTCFA